MCGNEATHFAEKDNIRLVVCEPHAKIGISGGHKLYRFKNASGKPREVNQDAGRHE